MEKEIKKTNKKTDKRSGHPRHHRYLFWVIIFLVVVLVIFAGSRFVQAEKEKSFKEGGQNAIGIIVTEINAKGGVGIKQGEAITVLAKYSKEISIPFETIDAGTQTQETTTEETTNTTETTTDTTNTTTETNTTEETNTTA